MDTSHNPFQKIKGRYFVFIWLFPIFLLPGVQEFTEFLYRHWTWYWVDVFYSYVFHIILLSTILIITGYGNLNWDIFFAKRIAHNDVKPALKLTVFLFLFSVALSYIIFFPLSYIFPRFVEVWYIEAYEIIFWDGHSFPVLSNILSFASVVLIAPVLEEIVFRGILFHRWAFKFNIVKAMLFSSILFGIVHPEPIGATAFGVGMCVLYLRTRTLIIPMLCHSLNNLVSWMFDAGYKIINGPDYIYTLVDFQNEWYWGIICAILCIVWIGIYLRHPVNIKQYNLPVVSKP